MVRFVAHFRLWMINFRSVHRRSGCLDVDVKRHGSDDQIFLKFRKIAEPADLASGNYDRLRQSTNERDLGCVPGLHGATLLVARALRDPDAFLHGRVPGSLGTCPRMGQNYGSSEV